MSLSFKDRIALHYMTATALVIAVVFLSVYVVVRATVIANVDADLSYEANKHTTEVLFTKDTVMFAGKDEWEEREHREIEVNPVFIQLIDADLNLMDRSPNLKEQVLAYNPDMADRKHYTSHLSNRHLRQVQVPILYDGAIRGHILAAMSLEPSLMVISKLQNVLLISYPIILLGLFFISRYLAGRSIIPVSAMRDTADRITRHNLKERVPLPPNRDELHGLSTSINELLQRIEDAMQRERQFTSDASHELRTPLSVLRGTLEVLIRKPRQQEEYERKVKESLAEIDRLAEIMEQLLALARAEKPRGSETDRKVELSDVLIMALTAYTSEATEKGVRVEVENQLSDSFPVPLENVQLILRNLIGNAIKYSNPNSEVRITLKLKDGKTVCEVADQGIGIKTDDLANIFNPFYRSDAMDHRAISGNGLGLAIAQRAAHAIEADILVESELGKGSTFTLVF